MLNQLIRTGGASAVWVLLTATPGVAETPGAGSEAAPESAVESAGAAWTQWGGVDRNFRAESSGLADAWGDGGPATLWSRELGDGYSAILVEGGRLYTMYRRDEQEVVVSLDASSGKTVWERPYDASPAEGHVDQFGRGPRATPLIVGDVLYTIGIAGHLHALDKGTGDVVWKRDLWREFGGNFLNHGYSSSPIVYKDMVIALVGGEGKSLVAFGAADGDVRWQAQSFGNSYSTPQVYDVGGRPQLITFMKSQVVGINPDNGGLEWSYDHENQWGQNINQPTLVDGEYLFFSSPQAGAHGVKLTRGGDGKISLEELWSTRKIQFYHVTSVLDGDTVYGSTGTQVSFMAAVDVKTGEIRWRQRGMAKSNVIEADGKLFVLDENGMLYVTKATPEKLEVLDEVQVLERPAWTVPTIVGKTMYLRDKKHIKALDLG
ncbi:MAG: PQQ-binding-like beta-propeller repeat protein [Acidobacteriota bacterium]